MSRAAVTATTLLLLAGLQGCALTGKVETMDCEARFHVSVGSAVGPCGLEGKGFSVPGAGVISGAIQTVAQVGSALLGRAPIVIEHNVADGE